MNHKNTGTIAAVFAAGIATGLLGSFLFPSHSRSEVARISSTEPTGTVIHPTAATSTYRNPVYGFALDYPSDLTVDEYDEGDGARTIVFRKGEEEVGFQMFITPYQAAVLSKDDLERIVPRLDLRTVKAATLGTSTPAFAFASNAPGMGPSREFRFAHDGHLFEITTYPDQGEWLTDILKTWQFD
jgi:hypothetical protein